MLTVREIDSAKPKAKPYKLADGSGLYIEVRPTGSKYWRMKYRIAGKEKLLAFGVYPDVRPPEARDKAKDARDLIRSGIDPNEAKKAIKRSAVTTTSEVHEPTRAIANSLPLVHPYAGMTLDQLATLTSLYVLAPRKEPVK